MVGKPKPGDSKSQRSILKVSVLLPFANQDTMMPGRIRKEGGKAEWLLTRERKSHVLIESDIQMSTSCLERGHQ